MRHRIIAAVSLASLLLAAAPPLAQGQLPRPGQLPPPGGQGGPPQRGQAAPPQQPAAAPAKPYKPVAITAPAAGHRSELRGVPQAARRRRREEGPQGARRPRRAELLLDGREGRQGRQEEARHRQSRQGDPARRQGRAGLGDARRGIRRSDRHCRFPDRKDTICAPADPTFNPQELEALAKATGTDEGDWAYPTQAGLEVHSGAAAQLAGGREARPAFRPRDGGQTRRATSEARC